MNRTLAITSTVKDYPRHPYQDMKNAVLGARYELSLAFVGAARAATLNRTYRNKSYTPDVLSFPLTDSAGEIIICPAAAVATARVLKRTPENTIAFLFIHGALHLKGYEHGATMERLEQRYATQFGIN